MIRLPRAFEASLTNLTNLNWQPASDRQLYFAGPSREAALLAHSSVSWRVFKNPVSLLIGGIAAVILELAEPRIRAAIWNDSVFLQDPVGRLRRTGLAAMVTIFAARSVSEPMIARVVRLHSRVSGETPSGLAYSAKDPALLTWVHITATYAFARAYSLFVDHLTTENLDSVCDEAAPVSRLYGAVDAPTNLHGFTHLFERTVDKLEPSDALQQFLGIMRNEPILPAGLRWLQSVAVRAAVDVIPAFIRDRLELRAQDGLRLRDELSIKLAGAAANRLVLTQSPPSQSCVRLGLPANYLYR